MTTIQGILTEDNVTVSQNMVRWVEGINRESIVLVEGTVQEPPRDQQQVKSTTIHEVEINIEKVHILQLDLTVYLLTLAIAFCCISPYHTSPVSGRRYLAAP